MSSLPLKTKSVGNHWNLYYLPLTLHLNDLPPYHVAFYVSGFVTLASKYMLNRFVTVPYGKPIETSL